MSDSNQCRIAIVEDDLDLQQSMQECLHVCGYKVWAAASAEAFYRRILVDPVDLVILDIGLPGEDGLSVAQHLREIDNLAVIIISGRVAVEDRLVGLRAGADCYLSKPVNLDELLANIKAIVRRLKMAIDKLASDKSLATAWQLDASDWMLYAPGGKFIKLTSGEFILVQMLILAQGDVVKKGDIAARIFESRMINGDERIAVLLSRLRHKADTTLGHAIPIKTVHQMGYVFSEQCIFK